MGAQVRRVHGEQPLRKGTELKANEGRDGRGRGGGNEAGGRGEVAGLGGSETKKEEVDRDGAGEAACGRVWGGESCGFEQLLRRGRGLSGNWGVAGNGAGSGGRRGGGVERPRLGEGARPVRKQLGCGRGERVRDGPGGFCSRPKR